eukprot:GEMP01072789.1.p1 GENE.GEMP01072789.1~~GEMP01072789.1.p1  ORF type:complete len:314 (+),score=56.42 GEMP01072789.1:32-943(+)
MVKFLARAPFFMSSLLAEFLVILFRFFKLTDQNKESTPKVRADGALRLTGQEYPAGENWPVLERVNEVQPEKMDNDANGTPENSTTANERDSTTGSMNAYVPAAGTLFVGGLPMSCKTEDLKWYFCQFGRVVDGIVMTRKQRVHAHISRGFGFVTFSNLSGKTAALEAYQSHYIHGKWVAVKEFIPKRDTKAATQLYQNTNYSDDNIANDHSGVKKEEDGPQPEGRDSNATHQKLAEKVKRLKRKEAKRQRKRRQRNDVINCQRMLQQCNWPLAPDFPRFTVAEWALIYMWSANPEERLERFF